MEDLYKILHCDDNASQRELRKSYQELALKFHPDKVGEQSNEKFIKINRAWTILGDPRLREQFDIRWKERCLAQAYPIQDTVDFEDFELQEEDEVGHEQTIDVCEFAVKSNHSNYNKTDGNENEGSVNNSNSNKASGLSIGCESVTSSETAKTLQMKGDNLDLITCNKDSKSCSAKSDGINKPDNVDNLKTESVTDMVNEINVETNTGDKSDPHEDSVFVYSCRCGGSYVLTGVDVKLKFDIVCCDTCSLSVQVIYSDDD